MNINLNTVDSKKSLEAGDCIVTYNKRRHKCFYLVGKHVLENGTPPQLGLFDLVYNAFFTLKGSSIEEVLNSTLQEEIIEIISAENLQLNYK